MINLLPPDVKVSTVYARRNTKLRKWCTLVFIAIVGVIIIVIFGQLYIDKSIRAHTKQAEATSQQLKDQKLEETQKEVTEISNNLQLVLQVLSREVLYSKLLQQIGATIPPGAALSDLNINKLTGGIDLRFNAANEQTVTQIHVNFKDPANKIFDEADLLNYTCASTNATDPRYLCQVTIRAKFAKDNPFLFISGQTAGANP